MTFLTPLAALALLAVPLIILIHYLRGSARRLRVPSVELWQGLAPGLTARNRIKRPPAGHPALVTGPHRPGTGHCAHASRKRGRHYPSPWARRRCVRQHAGSRCGSIAIEMARQAAIRRVRSLAPQDQVTLVRAGFRPTVEFSGDARDAETALQQLRPGTSPARLDDAVMRTALELSRTSKLRGEVVVLDSASDSSARLDSGAFPMEIVSVGGGAGNQAIAEFWLGSSRAPGQLTSSSSSTTMTRVPSGPGSKLWPMICHWPLDSSISRLGRVPTTVSVPLEAARITARLTTRDSLPLDDIAEVSLPSIRPRAVVAGLQRPIRAGASRAVHSGRTRGHGHIRRSAWRQADLTIFDGVTPKSLPARPVILVHPPGDNGIVR